MFQYFVSLLLTAGAAIAQLSVSTHSPKLASNETLPTIASPSAHLSDTYRGVACQRTGSTRIDHGQCAASASWLVHERTFYIHRRFGPGFHLIRWKAPHSTYEICLGAIDPEHGTDSFSFASVLARYQVILSMCEPWHHGGSAQVGIENNFFVIVGMVPDPGPANPSSVIRRLTRDLSPNQSISKALTMRKRQDQINNVNPPQSHQRPSFRKSTGQSKIVLNKTVDLDCGSPHEPHLEISRTICSEALGQFEADCRQRMYQSLVWKAQSPMAIRKIWGTPTTAPGKCYILLRGSSQDSPEDLFSYQDMSMEIQKIMRTCGGRPGRSAVGPRRNFSIVVSRSVWLQTSAGNTVNATSVETHRQTTLTSAHSVASTTSPVTVPDAVQKNIRTMKLASSLTFNSNQLFLDHVCQTLKADDARVSLLNTSSCSQTIMLMQSKLPGTGPQIYGPGFQPQSWQAPESECMLYLLSSDPDDRAQLSTQDILTATNTVLEDCDQDRTFGGIARVGHGSTGFFVAVVPSSNITSGPIASLNIGPQPVPTGGGGVSSESTSSSSSSQSGVSQKSTSVASSGPLASDINLSGLPVLPGGGGMNIVSTLPLLSSAASTIASSPPGSVQTSVGLDTS